MLGDADSFDAAEATEQSTAIASPRSAKSRVMACPTTDDDIDSAAAGQHSPELRLLSDHAAADRPRIRVADPSDAAVDPSQRLPRGDQGLPSQVLHVADARPAEQNRDPAALLHHRQVASPVTVQVLRKYERRVPIPSDPIVNLSLEGACTLVDED
jgi:hypothetical protein